MANRRVPVVLSKYSMVDRSEGNSGHGDDVVTIDLYPPTENPMNDGDVEMSPNSTSRLNNSRSSTRSAHDDDNNSSDEGSFVSKRPILTGVLGTFIALVLPFMISLIVVETRYKNALEELDATRNLADLLQQQKMQTNVDPWAKFEVTSEDGVVATDVEACSEIGVDIMRNGGNAIDAAVASALCLGVLNPSSSGIGGGCFINYYDKKTMTGRFYDSRETAPGSSSPTMFDDDQSLSVNGGMAVAVPGELKGLYTLHQDGGILPWKDVVAPSAQLAKRWTISSHMAEVINNDAKEYLLSGDYPELAALFIRGDGTLKQKGDTVEQPTLAQTLEGVAQHGVGYFYDTIAADLSKDVRDAGGIMTESDIKNYAVKIHEPIRINVLGHTLLSASGSSSGGAVIAGIVNFLEGYEQPMASQGHLYDHRLVEAMKHAFAIRLSLGDPDFVDTTGPIAALLDKGYMGNLRNLTSDSTVLPLDDYGGTYNLNAAGRRLLPEDHGTTHLSVLDSEGNAVAITSTVNTDFGSKVVSKSTGIILNNEMDDFSNSKAPNSYGLHPSQYNYPEPGKRPLSSMSPTILVDKDGNTRLVGGASGGPRIITATVQVLLNYMCCGMDNVLSALKHPRLHSQLIPETVFVEDHHLISGLSIVAGEETVEALSSRGHNITLWGHSMGVSQYIAVNPDNSDIHGVSDPRKDGAPAGL